jgi:hypothetical protein
VALTLTNLRDLRSREGALNAVRLLGYDAEAVPFPGRDFGLGDDAVRLRSHGRPDQGYGLLIGSTDGGVRSFKTLGRRLVEGFHDQPLAVIGVGGTDGAWRQAVVVRPRLIEGGGGAVSIARLTMDPTAPTAHDLEVLNGLAWEATDAATNQRRIDEALDVERVTRRFYLGLSQHHERLLQAVKALAARDRAVAVGIEAGQGPERVALRIVTQLLFCYFLQRKGLLERRPRWLREQYDAFVSRGRTGFHQAILEPLFYEAFALPPAQRPAVWRERQGIPFLNGGLFERAYLATLDLPDEVFSTDDGLLGFLDRWTFTVSEEAADEHEVAVDPEMLGKIFEHLVWEEEIRREGTVYTPRPVVQFMCREALVPYLERELAVDEATARRLLTDDDAFEAVDLPDPAALARRLDDAVARCTVLDPAVGSGAFPLGMLTEFVRLRRLAHTALTHREPSPGDLWNWKLAAVERSLFGVDINPGAVELCRLRLWLALLVEEETGAVHPLPNLDYRIICADSLTDFIAGFEVQNTRRGALTFLLGMPDPRHVITLRERYFEESRPTEKDALREQLAQQEDAVVERIFSEALENARLQQMAGTAAVRRLGASAADGVAELRAAYGTRDRRFPLYVPAFHAPEVVPPDGWSIVIMNPPYVGRKEVAQRIEGHRIADLALHYGRTYDLMIHFAFRALELVQPGGVVSMIFNDSIFTSEDADDLRRRLFDGQEVSVRTLARSRCFEGKAVNGGIMVAVASAASEWPIRWVENHGRPTTDLAGASIAAEPARGARTIGESELWVAARSAFSRLPHRPLFRPSPPAIRLLDAWDRCVGWREFGRYQSSSARGRQADWQLLSDTRALEAWKRNAELTGFYERLRPGSDFVLLGLVIEGGQGLATADDRRFLGALAGTDEASDALANQERYAALVRQRSEPRAVLDGELSAGVGLEAALISVADRYRPEQLGWPRSGLVRVVDPARVLHRRLTPDEVEHGLAGDRTWVPFEKGDSSDRDGGAAKWTRFNPIVIDWSTEAVTLLRQRARQSDSYRKPYFRNEHLWGQGGVTWNRTASYLRARRVEDGGIFSDKAPTVAPTVDWLTANGLVALLNAPTVDFLVRTFLGSRMEIEVGDLRRIPIPVLREQHRRDLDALGARAIAGKVARDAGQSKDMAAVEREIDVFVRGLYGIPRDADLWVVR